MFTRFRRTDRLKADVVVYRRSDVVVGSLRLGRTTLRRAIEIEQIHRLDDTLVQRANSDGVQSVPALDVARDSVIAIGSARRLERPIASGILVEAGPYLAYGQRRRRHSFLPSKVVEFDRAIVGHRAGSLWRQESVSPLFVAAGHITAMTRARRTDFEAACALRRVAGSLAGIGEPSAKGQPSRGRDPYWDLDGTAARTQRRNRRVVRALVVALSAVILGSTLLHLPVIDAPTLVHGPTRPFLFTALATDALAAMLVFSHQVRRKRRYGTHDGVG